MKSNQVGGTARLLVVGLTFVFGAVGCGEATEPMSSGDVGSVDVNLELDPTADVSLVDWALTGPNLYSRNGQIDTSTDNGVLSLQVRRIPVGTGYQIVLTASIDQGGSCTATATFDVTVDVVSNVNIVLKCERDTQSGGLRITGGTANFCPVLTQITASPTEGGTGFLVSVVADDEEGDQTAYLWTSGAGGFDDSAAAATTFECAATELVTVSIAITDDAFVECSDGEDIDLDCTGAYTGP